jgi:hypothetical protein
MAIPHVDVTVEIVRQRRAMPVPDAPMRARLRLEAELLLRTADSTFKFFVTDGTIGEALGDGALVLRYGGVQEAVITFNGQRLLFTAIIVPFAGRYGNGTLFYRGAYAAEFAEATPEPAAVGERLGVLLNSRGVRAVQALVEMVR